MKISLILLSAWLVTGCSVLNSHQVKHPDGTIESHTRITSFWDSNSNLQKLRATMTDKTTGLTLAGLEQESSSTNSVELLRAVGSILQNLPK